MKRSLLSWLPVVLALMLLSSAHSQEQKLPLALTSLIEAERAFARPSVEPGGEIGPHPAGFAQLFLVRLRLGLGGGRRRRADAFADGSGRILCARRVARKRERRGCDRYHDSSERVATQRAAAQAVTRALLICQSKNFSPNNYPFSARMSLSQ
jgi:hypothetical protein